MSDRQNVHPSATAKPVLAIEGLSLRLPAGADREFAVESVSLTVKEREIVCLVGESGSGKSVTAHAVMGLLPRSEVFTASGSILLESENLVDATEKRLRDLRGSQMAMIFQEPMTALNPVVQVGFQIEEVLKIHTKMSRADRRKRVLEVVEDVRLPDPAKILKCYPHQLSGGQRQRVMIAAALVLRPKLLIADEPTTALDVTTQAQILKLIRELQETYNTGVLFITHDFGVVADIADRVLVMEAGRIVEAGDANEILYRPTHPYTKKLITAIPSLSPRIRPIDDAKTKILKLKNVSKVYRSKSLVRRGREVLAVTKVSLEIGQGETLGIVGESGSGKSTLARCVARLIGPTGGEIEISGSDIAGLRGAELKRHRGEIQIVFQDPYRSLNPRRTVGESLIEAPMNFGMGRSEAVEKARMLMGTVGLDPDSIHRYPHQFSGGQRQRVCIARALAVNPKVLIADEAVSALDVSIQAQVLSLFEDIRDSFDLTTLFITHDLRVAAQICSRIAVMKSGQIVEIGPTREVFENPHHPYTQSLLAAVPGQTRAFWTPLGKTLDTVQA